MFEKVQIIFSGLDGSEPVRTEVRAWLTKMAPLTGEEELTAGHVLIEASYQHHRGAGWRYQASLELTTSMGVVAIAADCAGNNPSDDIYVAIRNVFRCTRRALTALQEQTVRPARPPAVAPPAPFAPTDADLPLEFSLSRTATEAEGQG